MTTNVSRVYPFQVLVPADESGLGPEWDVEVLEMHHRMKVDAPSGTATAMVRARARTGSNRFPDRMGEPPYALGELPPSTLTAGLVEHTGRTGRLARIGGIAPKLPLLGVLFLRDRASLALGIAAAAVTLVILARVS